MNTVKIKICELSENIYTDKDGNSYDIPTIIQFCKENNYGVFDIPLISIDLSVVVWDKCNSVYDFLYHSKRVINSDTNIPIILSSQGEIIDGYHRICKAILNGDEFIKAIRMEEMPFPSCNKDTNTK